MSDSRFGFSLSAKPKEMVVAAYLYSFQFVPGESFVPRSRRHALFSLSHHESVSSIVCLVLALPLVLCLREQPLR